MRLLTFQLFFLLTIPGTIWFRLTNGLFANFLKRFWINTCLKILNYNIVLPSEGKFPKRCLIVSNHRTMFEHCFFGLLFDNKKDVRIRGYSVSVITNTNWPISFTLNRTRFTFIKSHLKWKWAVSSMPKLLFSFCLLVCKICKSLHKHHN